MRLAIILLALALGGCGTLGWAPGNPKLAVNITDECEKEAEEADKIPEPALRAGADEFIALARYRKAFKLVKRTITNVHTCMKDVRTDYARGR